MLPVSPLKNRSYLDRVQRKHLYRAVDFQGERPRYLHMSGTSITSDKNYSWMGTRPQFEKLKAVHEWDGFTLVPLKDVDF